VAEIQEHSRAVIEGCYRNFLLQSGDPDEREYPDASDQVREVLIHANYLSQKDVTVCLGFVIGALANEPGYKECSSCMRRYEQFTRMSRLRPCLLSRVLLSPHPRVTATPVPR